MMNYFKFYISNLFFFKVLKRNYSFIFLGFLFFIFLNIFIILFSYYYFNNIFMLFYFLNLFLYFFINILFLKINLLFLLTFLPLFFVFILLIIDKSKLNFIRIFSLISSLFIFLLFSFLCFFFDYNVSGYQFIYFINFSTFISSQIFMGLDGLSLSFIGLTAYIIPFCIYCSWDIHKKPKEFFILLFLMEFFLFLIFSTRNFLFFYISFELALLPIFIIIGVWGLRERRVLASYRIFLYTLTGSLFILFSIIYMVYSVGSIDLYSLQDYNFSLNEQLILFSMLSFGFFIKIPMFPVHIWLPEAHVEAPTAGSVLLAGILLKLGGYGFLRFVIPVFPIAYIKLRLIIFVFAILGIIYGSFVTIRQVDLKKIVAYSSVVHMNFSLVGMFSDSFIAIKGSIVSMLAHGVISSALFLCVGMLYERYGTRLIVYYGGISKHMPIFSFFFTVFILANMSVPLTANFIGETLIFFGIYQENTFVTILSSSSIILGAAYSIWLLNRVCFGPTNYFYLKYFSDLNFREFIILFPFIFLVFFLGVFPNPMLYVLDFSISEILTHF